MQTLFQPVSPFACMSVNFSPTLSKVKPQYKAGPVNRRLICQQWNHLPSQSCSYLCWQPRSKDIHHKAIFCLYRPTKIHQPVNIQRPQPLFNLQHNTPQFEQNMMMSGQRNRNLLMVPTTLQADQDGQPQNQSKFTHRDQNLVESKPA